MQRPRYRCLVASVLVLLVFLWPSCLVQAAPPYPTYTPDEIRERYEGDPAQRLLPDEARQALGQALPVVSVPRAGATADRPVWSKLVFMSFRTGNWDVYQLNPDGSGDARLTNGASVEIYPAAKRGMQQVAYVNDRDGNQEIYAINTDGTGDRRLTDNPLSDTLPAWSPDGTRIAFQSTRSGKSDIYVMDADGGNTRLLAGSGEFDGHPSWSPDGTQIVFSSWRTGRYELWTMDANGGSQRQLTYGMTALYPSWSPRGDIIAFSNDSDSDGFLEIWTINVDGSGAKRIADDGNGIDQWMPAWAPDGRWLALTQTYWTVYQGQLYWVHSYLQLIEVGGEGGYQYSNDDRVWKADWGTLDNTPPGPCTLTVAGQQRARTFLVTAVAQDNGPAGIGSYDLQVRPVGGSWQDCALRQGSRIVYTAPADGRYEFRARARDASWNAAGWAGAAVKGAVVDATLPASTIWPPVPNLVRGTQTNIRWRGADPGAGVSFFDVWLRKTGSPDWERWLSGVTSTEAVLSGQPGETYELRSQATDGVGHREPWRPEAEARVTFYARTLDLFTRDNRGLPTRAAKAELEPEPASFAEADRQGHTIFYLNGALTHTLTVYSWPGRPASTALPTGSDSQYTVVLPPGDDQVANGGWEDGTLAGWTGHGAQVDAAAAHSGGYGLQLSGGAAISQSVTISQAVHAPTLSLFYRIPTDLAGGALRVTVQGTTTATVLVTGTATMGWAHAWADLTPWAGQSVTVAIDLAGAGGEAQVDEVSLGSWFSPAVDDISPRTWPVGQRQVVTITGRNLMAPVDVQLGGRTLSEVTWISPTMVTAVAPPSLPAGDHVLVVTNPGGHECVLPGAVHLGAGTLYLPFAGRQTAPWLAPRADSAYLTLGYDAAHTGNAAADAGGSLYSPAWSTALPFDGYRKQDQIAVADGVLVATGDPRYRDGGVAALDAVTGRLLWTLPMNDKHSISPPTVAHGAVYFQECNASYDSYLFSLDLYTGAERWRSPFVAEYRNFLHPLVVDRTVYYAAGFGPELCSADAFTGAPGYIQGIGDFDRWTPAYADGKLYTWVKGYFRCHNPQDGQVLWQLYLEWDWHNYSMDTAPVIAGRTALITAPGALRAVDLDTHQVRWSAPGGYDDTLAAVRDGVVYALNSGTLEARNLGDGSLLWTFAGDNSLRFAPVIAGPSVYVASESHTYVVDLAKHEAMWQADHGGWLSVANGYLYVAQADHTIWAYKAQR